MSGLTFDDVRAQPAAIATLRRATQQDRVASAYLFEGPSGVGKARTAMALAAALLCPSKPRVGCGTCETCRRITEGNHPDVRTFRPRDEGDRNLQVQLIRSEILPFTQYAPFEARAAVLIFPEADVSFPAQHAEAANALLKTLEEPRPNVHFVLLSERPQALLATIRSRAQRVRFQRLPPLTLLQILEEANIPEERRDAAVALADGRADVALRLAAEGAADALLARAVRIDRVTDQAKPGALVELADELAKSDDLTLALDTLAMYYRDVAAASLGCHDLLVFAHVGDEIAERAKTLDAARCAARSELLRDAADALDRNGNTELVLDALLFELRDAG